MHLSRRTLVAVLLLAAALAALGLPSVAAPSHPNLQHPTARAALAAPVCSAVRAGNSAGQVTFISTANPQIYTSTSFNNVACGTTSFTVPYGRRALVTVDVAAETDCSGGATQWCQARVLVNGSEAAPVAAEPDSFAWDEGSALYDWQAHAFTRAPLRLFSCAVSTGCSYPVVLQTRNHAAGMSLWVDELTVTVRVLYA